MVDPERVRPSNDAPVRPERDWVLYWMVSARRVGFNPALEHAANWARSLGKPLVVLDTLRHDPRWATARSHAFAMAGMADLAPRLARAGVAHHPYVEPAPGAARGLLTALAARACRVVTDDDATAAPPLDVALDVVDGVGLLPVRAAPRVFVRAVDFRRFLVDGLPPRLARSPVADPLGAPLPPAPPPPADLLARWPATPPGAPVPVGVDATVPPVDVPGGERAALARLDRFLDRLADYPEDRRHPDRDGTSRLSPYLHAGHLSPHAILAGIAGRAGIDLGDDGLAALPSPHAAFLEELVTWRELAHHTAAFVPDSDRYGSLPAWACATLAKHAGDPRPVVYDAATLDAARTHDPLWNAAQRQLVREGWMHNQLRMLWGKKVLEWSATPEAAFETLLDLNNRHALDGRDANSVAGVAWVFGRYDRPWGPERTIFGLVRYMSSASATRKLQVRELLARHGA